MVGWNKKDVPTTDPSHKFVQRHWHRINRATGVARLRERYGEQAKAYDWFSGAWLKQLSGIRFYECDQFDPHSNECTAQDRKPYICRGFPWYGGEPHTGILKGLGNCSFHIDVNEAGDNIDGAGSSEGETSKT